MISCSCCLHLSMSCKPVTIKFLGKEQRGVRLAQTAQHNPHNGFQVTVVKMARSGNTGVDNQGDSRVRDSHTN